MNSKLIAIHRGPRSKIAKYLSDHIQIAAIHVHESDFAVELDDAFCEHAQECERHRAIFLEGLERLKNLFLEKTKPLAHS